VAGEKSKLKNTEIWKGEGIGDGHQHGSQ